MDREGFMSIVYDELYSDGDNNRANRIIDAADEYAESAQLGTNLAEVGTDLISRKAAIDALWKAMYEYEDKTEKQFQESEDLDVGDWIEHRIFVQNMNDIDRQTIMQLPPAQPEQRWIPVTVINQNYIPELKDFPYGGLLFTYRTPKGKLLVREAWVERGRIIGKKMNGTPIAYQQKPEPWEGVAE